MTELEPAHLRALRKSGIQPPFRLYDLRRTYGTRAVEAGMMYSAWRNSWATRICAPPSATCICPNRI